MKTHLLIKGTVDDARNALVQHSIALVGNEQFELLDSQTDDSSVSVLVESASDLGAVLVSWYCEPPRDPPFPPGTLLYYGPANAAQEIVEGAIDENLDPDR